MITQKNQILAHMRERGGITSYEAFALYRITRLASRIYEIRQDGHKIKKEHVHKKDEAGRVVDYDVYMLDEEA